MERIAVYGTLKKGYWNYERFIEPHLESGKVRFVGNGIVRGYLIGGDVIPFAKRTNNQDNYIKVEVYEINDEKVMRSIDQLEGAYKKVKVKVEMNNGEIIDAFMYDGSHLTSHAFAKSYEELIY